MNYYKYTEFVLRATHVTTQLLECLRLSGQGDEDGVCSNYTLVVSGLRDADYRLRQGDLEGCKRILQRHREMVRQISSACTLDPFVRTLAATLPRIFNALVGNAMDILQKKRPMHVEDVQRMDAVPDGHFCLSRKTPAGLIVTASRFADDAAGAVCSTLQPYLDFEVGFEPALSPPSPGVSVSKRHTGHTLESCAYCLLAAPHCYDAAFSFADCCAHADCVGRMRLEEIVSYPSLTHLSPCQIQIVYLFRFAILRTELLKIGYEVAVPPKGTLNFDYPKFSELFKIFLSKQKEMKEDAKKSEEEKKEN